MSPEGAGEDTAREAVGDPAGPNALAQGLLAEAVDCIAQASHAIGDDERRAVLGRHAEALTEFAEQLRTSSD